MSNLKPEHLKALKFVSHPVIHPSGKSAAVVETFIRDDEEGIPLYQSNIFLYDLDKQSKKQLTRSSFADTKPQFSPDGKQLAFLSKRKEAEKAQLYLLELSGGEAKKVSGFNAGVESFAWHPKGSQIAFISRGDWQKEEKPSRYINDLKYKFNGVGFLPNESNQIHLYDLEKETLSVLTNLEKDAYELAFSPDARTLFFTAQDASKQANEWKRCLYTLDLKTK